MDGSYFEQNTSPQKLLTQTPISHSVGEFTSQVDVVNHHLSELASQPTDMTSHPLLKGLSPHPPEVIKHKLEESPPNTAEVVNHELEELAPHSSKVYPPEINNEKGKKKRVWVIDKNMKRDKLGEYQFAKELRSDPDRFLEYFRMTPEKFDELVRILEPSLRRKDTNFRRAITVEEQISVALRFISSGDSFQRISTSYRLGCSTVREAVINVCQAIWEKMQEEYLPSPTKETWAHNASQFYEKWGFPHCVGAIDGKHIVILPCQKSGLTYANSQGSSSLILLALIDANCCFTAIDICACEGEEDGEVLKRSELGKALKMGVLEFPKAETFHNSTELEPVPFVVVGSKAFPQTDNILRPFPEKYLSEEKSIYNYMISRIRRVCSNTFGLFTQRWRLYHRRMNILPDSAVKIVRASVVLHNFIQRDMVIDSTLDTIGLPNSIEIHPENCIGSNAKRNKKDIGMFEIDAVYRGNHAGNVATKIRNSFMGHFLSTPSVTSIYYNSSIKEPIHRVPLIAEQT